MKLPLTFDLTSKGKIVERKHIGEKGYIENIQYTLQFNIEEDGVYISYYGEDDTFIDENRIDEIIKLIK